MIDRQACSASRTRFAWLALLLVLAACQHATDSQPSDADVLHAEALRPSEAELSAKYERSCLNCHAVRSAAPLAGYVPAWAARLPQGEERLLGHAREGFNGMPARGQCLDCSDAELLALIRFMSQAH